MTIQPSANKTNNVTFPWQSTANKKVQNTDEQTSGKVQDRVDFTNVAKKITEAFESSDPTLAIDKTHINKVKKAIMEGTYPINAEQIAKKMIEMEREPDINSR